jgi:outer membrane immunogenic protein
MKKMLFAGAAAVALIAANTASAADLGLPVKGRALEPAWNWSGFYAGLNAGYARGNTVWNDFDGTFTSGDSIGSIVNESDNGFIGGGQVGYNLQFRHAVFGLEADFDYLSLNQTTHLFDLAGPGFVSEQFHDSVPWLGTVRARAGLALDNVLTYLTAGLAYGRTDHSVSDVTVGIPATETIHDFSSTKAGPVGGVGMEYGLDSHWSVRAEALYVDLGKHTEIFQADANVFTTGRLETVDTMWIVRAGINYKFGG